MFAPSASTAAIVAVPRLPVGQLILLRGLVDRHRELMEKAEYIRGDAVDDLQQAPHRACGKLRWIAQRKVANNAISGR
jgi:hypothetical protein